MTAQHQHYVPKLLLRGFLSNDPKQAAKAQVHVFDLEAGKPFLTSIDNIMGERRYNDFWVDDELMATVEPWTNQIESHLAPLVERIRVERTLEGTPEESASLALLIAFQFVRTKSMRLMPERLNEQLRRQVRRMGFDPKNVQGLVDFDEEGLKKQHLRVQVKNLEKYAGLVAEKQFFLMAAAEGHYFYLGDHPVVLHNDEPKTMYSGRLGIGAPYIQIYLPLSSGVMLCAYDKAVLGQMKKASDEAFDQDMAGVALSQLMGGKISIGQMKTALDAARALDPVAEMIRNVRSGQPILIGADQVHHYNALQAFFAHRFVVDPSADFTVATEMIDERKLAADLGQ